MSLVDRDFIRGNILDEVEALKERLAILERAAVTGEAMKSENYGLIAGGWYKDPIRLGFSDVIRDSVQNTSLTGGAENLEGNAVPAGEIWVLTHISFMYNGTLPTDIRIIMVAGGSGDTMIQYPSSALASNRYQGETGYWILEEGDYIRMRMLNATASDAAYLNAWGFKVDIDQV